MKCEYCKKREGEKYTRTGNGHCVVFYLCPECYKKLNNLGVDPYEAVLEMIERDGTECEVCGYTVDDFKDTFLLGCPKCYEEMRDVVSSVIARVQNANVHTGKRPGGKR